MFDVSFGEFALIGLVALVVLGPERLPKVARTAGHLFGRLQRYVTDVKADINREIQLEDLKKLQQQMAQSAQEMESSLSEGMKEVEARLKQTAIELENGMKPGAEGAEPPQPAPEVTPAAQVAELPQPPQAPPSPQIPEPPALVEAAPSPQAADGATKQV